MNRPADEKNILNRDKEPQATPAIVETPVKTLVETPVDDRKPFIIDNGKEWFSIKISKDFINSSTRDDVLSMLKLIASPLFLTIPKDEQFLRLREKEKERTIGHIGIFMDMLAHYTGGRYSVFQQAVILGEMFDVTVITNREVPFREDFADYDGYKNVEVLIDSSWLMNLVKNKFDLVIGVPNLSAQYAYEYCKKWQIPFYCYMFESPNYVKMYRDGMDSDEDWWANFKKVIIKADVKISPSKTSSKYLREWLGIYDNSYTVVYPCMNVSVANKAASDLIPEYKKDIVYVSRMTSFKNPLEILKGLERKGWSGTVHIICKKWQEAQMVEAFESTKVKFHGIITDYEKFRIIASCALMIFPSKFEGFGMPPMEALYFNKPCIAYKIPVLEEVYRDQLIYVNSGDYKRFVNTILYVMTNYEKSIPTYIPDHTYPSACKEALVSILPRNKIAKVTAGIIAFNSMDYLPYAVKAIYPFVDQIIIVEGAVRGMERSADEEFHSTDGTFEWLIDNDSELKDVGNKISIVARNGDRPWHDKVEMQNAIAERVRGDIYFKIDADEIWDSAIFNSVVKFMIENKNVDIIRMPFIHLWTNFGTIAVDAGGKWSTCHPRVWRWKKSFRHRKSFNSFINTAHDNRKVAEPHYCEYVWKKDEAIYHFGYARKLNYVSQKLRYYAKRGIEKVVRTNVYEVWKKLEDATQPTQSVRSWAVEFNRDMLPDVLKEHPYYNVDDIRHCEVKDG